VIGQENARRRSPWPSTAISGAWRQRAGQRRTDQEQYPAHRPDRHRQDLLCETLARILDLPFVTADATSLAQTQFVGDEIEAILHRLLDRAGGDIGGPSAASSSSTSRQAQGGGWPKPRHLGESVQHALLKIMEGAPVKLKDGRHIDTTHILFICGGAFGLDHILTKTHTFGFIATQSGDDQKILERLNARIKPTDLLEFGLIPEFAGRLPIVTRLHDLTQDMLVRILTNRRMPSTSNSRPCWRPMA
jgi:ATP-dependent Clp protease ATP-binding subunit ClpX